MELVKEFLKSIPCEKATEEALEKVVDKKKIRNYLIIKEFDKEFKRGKLSVIDIFYKIGEKFEIGHSLVKLIVSRRKENQI